MDPSTTALCKLSRVPEQMWQRVLPQAMLLWCPPRWTLAGCGCGSHCAWSLHVVACHWRVGCHACWLVGCALHISEKVAALLSAKQRSSRDDSLRGRPSSVSDPLLAQRVLACVDTRPEEREGGRENASGERARGASPKTQNLLAACSGPLA